MTASTPLHRTSSKRCVFLCYASEDKAVADGLYCKLHEAGVPVWMDKPPAPYQTHGLPPGCDWDAEIQKRISEAGYFVALLSQRSVAKRSYVQREYRQALELMSEMPPGSRFFVPVLIEPCEIPDLRVNGISLRSYQWYSLEESGMDGLVAFLKGPGEDESEVSAPARNDMWSGAYAALLAREQEIVPRLFPSRPPELPGYDLAWWHRGTRTHEKEFFDCIGLPGGGVAMVLGEAAGFGIGSALAAGRMHTALRMACNSLTSPAQILHTVNDTMRGTEAHLWYGACLCAVFDPQGALVSLASAGHQAPFLIGAQGESSAVDVRGLPLGMFEVPTFTESAIRPAIGEVLLFMTDGVPEAMGADGDCFGATRAVKIVQDYLHDASALIVSRIAFELEKHAHWGPPSDSQTLVVVKRAR